MLFIAIALSVDAVMHDPAYTVTRTTALKSIFQLLKRETENLKKEIQWHNYLEDKALSFNLTNLNEISEM